MSAAPREPRVDAVLLGAAVLLFWVSQRADSNATGFHLDDRDGALRVVTWNVGSAVGETDHGLLPGVERAVIDTLCQLDADLVLLQELTDTRQIDRVRDAISVGVRGCVFARARGRYLAILAPRGELSLLSRREDAAVIARLSLPERAVTVACVHADPWSADARNQAIGETLDRLLRFDGPHLLGGDLNFDLDLDKRRDLFSDDAYLDVETYNYLSSRLLDVTQGTGSTAEPDRRLDYLFVDTEITGANAGPWRDRRVGAMDHDPVVADLVMRTER